MIEELEAKLCALDARVEAEKVAYGGVTLATALAWWDVATTLRDLREGSRDGGRSRRVRLH